VVCRQCIKCRACSSVTLLRLQVGWLDATPFAIGCKGCGAILRGKLIQDQKNVSLDLQLENSDRVDEPSDGNIVQEVECSGEFPVKRYFGTRAGELKLSPFIVASGFMGEAYIVFKANIYKYLAVRRTKWSELSTVIDLYAAKNYGAASNLLKQHFPAKDETPDLRTLVSHFYDVIDSIIQCLLPPNHFNKRTLYLLRFFGDAKRTNEKELGRLVEYLYNELDVLGLESEGINILTRFLNHFDYFLPTICLSYYSKGSVPQPLGAEYLITTTDFDIVKQFYADSYEWICRALPLLMGAENIRTRAEYNSMPTIRRHRTIKRIHSLSDFQHAPNAIKKEFIGTSPGLKQYFSSILDNQIRNAVSHYKTRLDPVEQLIEYFPFNDPAHAQKSKHIYLIDFVNNTYAQLASVWDVLYLIGGVRVSANQ